MKKIAAFVLLLLALVCLAFGVLAEEIEAAEYAPGTMMEPPEEVLSYIRRNYPQYALEDYCEIADTPDGDYGFALLHSGTRRVLVGYEEKKGKMTYWLRSTGAVMQGKPEAWFEFAPKGTLRYNEAGEQVEADGLSFGVVCLDDVGECYQKSIFYHWEDGGFKLTSYKDWDHFYGEVDVADGVLHFKNFMEGWDFGKARGTIQRDLRYVNFASLPKTIEEAKRELTHAPDLPHGAFFKPQEIKFAGGRSYPVYTGPGEHTMRSGKGKGSVSTNDWIQVFGRLGDWIMIQYDISKDRYRIGWIEASALPRGAKVETFDRAFEYYALEDMLDNTVLRACSLTDDPFNSREEIAYLEAGTLITEIVYDYEGWSYIRTVINGQEVFGFVPSDCIDHG